MTHTATAPVQEALFGRFGEVQTDIFGQIADAQAEATRPAHAEGDAVTVHATNGRKLGAGRVIRVTPSGLIVSYLFRDRIRTVCIHPTLVRAQ